MRSRRNHGSMAGNVRAGARRGLRPAQLRTQLKQLLAVQHSQLTLVFESFAF